MRHTGPVTRPPVHPDLAPLAFLLGAWAGEGVGDYPTIERFLYREEMSFTHAGKPFFAYAQQTWSLGNGAPMHSETGYWRPQQGGGVEIVLAHPFGVVEIAEGTLDGRRVSLSSTTMAATSSADEVAQVTRTIEVEGDLLRYSVDMAAAEQPLQRHLEAELNRVSG